MTEKTEERILSYEMIAKALFENYESIYEIDAETSAYRCYHESEAYRKLEIADRGDDFFAVLPKNVARTICPEDRAYVAQMLNRDALLTGVQTEKYYAFVYRIQRNGQEVYHQIRATLQTEGERSFILMGIRDIDVLMRQEISHREELASMRQKEQNHMEAILGSAAAYVEANLTKDIVLERSLDYTTPDGQPAIVIPPQSDMQHYSELQRWIRRHIIAINAEKYEEISSIKYLLDCFARGEKRASISFSVRMLTGELQPCREVFHLYQDHSSGDIFTFCVIYDLTEQQKREKEMEELENELRLSRIHNFTSQMQPHFLYNALGSIQEIILSDPEYASDLIGDFTIHLRSCIRAMANDQPLPFSQELDNIRAYVNIEKMRFGEKLKIRYEINATAFSILPLSIQPLVENAIRHGVYERGMQGGTVTIRTMEREDAWVIQVEDDGVGFDYEKYQEEMQQGKRDSTGLKNIMFRLDKMMHAQMEIHSAVGKGTTVTVTLPREAGLESSDDI